MRLFVSGPVTGRFNDNRHMFEQAATELENIGYDVLIPHWFVPKGTPWDKAMRRSIETMLRCDGVAKLPGGEHSKGSMLECSLAFDLKIPVLEITEWLDRPIKE